MADQFLNAEATVKKLNTAFVEHASVIDKAGDSLERLEKLYIKLPSEALKSVKSLGTEKQKLATSTKQLNEAEKETERLEKAVLRQRERLKQATSQNAKEVVKLREETNRVNRELRQNAKETSKNISEYKKLDIALTKTRNAAKEVGAEMFRLERTGKQNTDTYRKLQAEFDRLSKATNILDKGIKDIDKSLGQHQREVGNYKIATENLHPALGRVNSQLAMMGLSLDGLAGSGGFAAAGQALKNFGRATLTFLLSPVGLALTVLGGLYMLIRNNKDTVIEFDRQLTVVGKTTGLAGDELSGLGEEIVMLSRKLKVVGTPALLEYATVAGQLGIKGSENILKFTETLAKLETASDISGEEGAANIARLLTLTDGGVQNIEAFGDEIASLGNNFAATENEILGNATAIGQNVAQYKFGRQAVLAFAVATKAVGIESELTGSTLGRTLGIIEKSLRTGQNAQVLTELTGKSVAELQRIFKEDSSQALALFVEGLNNVYDAGGSVNEQLEAIGITSVRDQRVIGSLATKGFDLLSLAMLDAASAAGTLDEEFEAGANSLQNRLGKFGVAWDNLVLSIEDGQGVVSQFFAILSESGAWVLDLVTNRFNDFNTILNSGESLITKYASAAENLILPLKWLNQLRGRDNETMAKEIRLREENIKTFKEEWKSTNELITVKKDLNEEYKKQIEYLEEIIGIGLDTNKTQETQRRTIASIKEEMSALNEEIENSNATDIEGIRIKQQKIAALQRELDAILGTTKATNDKRKAIEQILTPLQKYVDRLKAVRDEFELQQASQLKAAKSEHESTDALVRYATKAGHTTEKVKELRISVQELQEIFGTLNNSAFNIDFANIGTIFHGLIEGFESAGDAAEAFGKLAIDVFGEITRSQNLNLQNQIRNLEMQRNVEIEYAGDSAEARAGIEERFNKEKIRLQREQAKNSKAMAILEAVVSTSVAVIKALAVGPPQGFLLAALVGALGAAQIATIAAAPLPQFKDGVRNFEGGQAIVGDGGKREPITDKSGKLIGISPAKSTLVDLPKGANVYSSEGEFYRELNGLLGSNNIIPIPTSGQNLSKNDVYEAMKKAIGSEPKETIILDKNGFTVSMVKGATRVNNLNNRVTVRGKNV